MFHTIITILGIVLFVKFFTSRSTGTLVLLLIGFCLLFMNLYIDWDNIQLVTEKGGGLMGVILMCIAPLYILWILASRVARKSKN
jgi:hypothetical protein